MVDISDSWELGFRTIIVSWQLRVTLESIRNSCNVFPGDPLEKHKVQNLNLVSILRYVNFKRPVISEVRAHVWGAERGVLTSCKANSPQLNWLLVCICISIYSISAHLKYYWTQVHLALTSSFAPFGCSGRVTHTMVPSFYSVNPDFLWRSSRTGLAFRGAGQAACSPMGGAGRASLC